MKKKIQSIALVLMCLWLLPGNVFAVDLLVPVGQVVGLQLSQDTVTVAAFDDTLGGNAKVAGLCVGDEITAIDGKKIKSAQDVLEALKCSDGSVKLQINRNGKTRELQLTPEPTSQGPRLGIYLRDGISGIGTVTWYDPDTGKFGALGHGVNNAKGKLVNMLRGKTYAASILSVKKGTPGEPGQLRGAVTSEQETGVLYRNTDQGIFGTTSQGWLGEALPVGQIDQVRTGGANILSTVEGRSVQEYSVEILKIYPNPKAAGRNFLLRVTDPALLEATGGIVQGMSGSPIIQDGKLIGAVTHVLVNDPTTGYGIFIENMLDAAG